MGGFTGSAAHPAHGDDATWSYGSNEHSVGRFLANLRRPSMETDVCV